VSAIDTERFRSTLLEERQRVIDAIEYLHEENPGSQRDETGEVPMDNHPADAATETFDREVDYTLEENSEHVLAAIDAALERIQEGTFGICRTCGQPIGEERLAAIPWATQCIDCKRKEERG
jgi:RNA polymerase-binding protein DksA